MNIVKHNHTLALEGSIDFQNAGDLIKTFNKLSSGESDLIIDCKEVKNANSVVLAVLLEMIKISNKVEKKISIINLPQNLKRLAKVSHLEDLFN